MIYGYAQVSTDGQGVDAQVKARRAAGAERPPKLTRHRREEALAALAEGSATQADFAAVQVFPEHDFEDRGLVARRK